MVSAATAPLGCELTSIVTEDVKLGFVVTPESACGWIADGGPGGKRVFRISQPFGKWKHRMAT